MRSIRIVGRLSVIFGVFGIVALPLAIAIANVIPPNPLTLSLQPLLAIIVGNLHWVDPQGAIAKGFVVDIPLAFLLLASGLKMLRGHSAGRSLAILYSALTIAIETFGFIRVYLPSQPERVRIGLDIPPAIALAAMAAKVVYPVVLLSFFLYPSVRRYFR